MQKYISGITLGIQIDNVCFNLICHKRKIPLIILEAFRISMRIAFYPIFRSTSNCFVSAITLNPDAIGIFLSVVNSICVNLNYQPFYVTASNTVKTAAWEAQIDFYTIM